MMTISRLFICAAAALAVGSLIIGSAVAGTSTGWVPIGGIGAGLQCGTTGTNWACLPSLGLCEQQNNIHCYQSCRYDAMGNVTGVKCYDDNSNW